MFDKKRVSCAILCLFFLHMVTFAQTIQRVEPPFWWVNMNEKELQLLVYGQDIANLKPVIQYEGVEVNRTIRVENDNYLFIDILIKPEAIPGIFVINFVKEQETVLSHSYELKGRNNGSASRQGFNPSDVVYLITPDRFANGDPDNDNIEGYLDKSNRSEPYGRHGGDIKGIIDHLDYIEDMGFTSIWLNPVQENAMRRHSYHGYAITDYYKIDPRFGSTEDYVRLVDECRKRNIKVIMDMVANHCGSSHWWMTDLPSSNWVNFQDAYRITNHRKSTAIDPYVADGDRKLMQDGWFVPSMPDLNQNNPLLAKYIIQNSIWWIEYAGLSGIRQDTYSYPEESFMSDWSCAIMDEYPNFNIVGEEWSENPLQVAYWQKGQNWTQSCLPSLMDFPINKALIEGLKREDKWHQGFPALYEMLGNDFIYTDPDQLMVFGDNHDMSRIYTSLDEDFDLFKMAMVYILTIRGIPQIFYGTEILMSNPGTESHGIIRSDMPGGWIGDSIDAFTGEGLAEQQKEAQDFIRQLLNWRKKSIEVPFGKLIHYIPENGVYVYFRLLVDKGVMIILNKNGTQLDFSRFYEVLEGVDSGKEVISGETVSFNESYFLSPKSAHVIQFNIPVRNR